MLSELPSDHFKCVRNCQVLMAINGYQWENTADLQSSPQPALRERLQVHQEFGFLPLPCNYSFTLTSTWICSYIGSKIGCSSLKASASMMRWECEDRRRRARRRMCSILTRSQDTSVRIWTQFWRYCQILVFQCDVLLFCSIWGRERRRPRGGLRRKRRRKRRKRGGVLLLRLVRLMQARKRQERLRDLGALAASQ